MRGDAGSGTIMATSELGIDGIGTVQEIGRGGFGVVYRATESDLGRPVAIKVLHGQFDERAKMRFDRERLAMGSLSGHPNIVTVYRSGFTAAGQPFLLMEYLDGGSMADQLQRRGRLPWTDVAKAGVEIAGALATAHQAGVLHRDVKPGNILVSSSGAAKLADFGIARLHGAPETRSAVITASVAHAPPEVIGGARPDERADIYSLASTVFELAWGSPAFVGADDESLVPMLTRIATGTPPDLTTVGVPPALSEVIALAMSKEKERRYPTAEAFARALESARSASNGLTSTNTPSAATLANATQAVAPLPSAPSPVFPPTAGPERSAVDPLRRGRRVRRLLLTGTALAALCVASVAAFLLVPDDSEPPVQELGSSATDGPAANDPVTPASSPSSSPASSVTSDATAPPSSGSASATTTSTVTQNTRSTSLPTVAESPIARTRQVSNTSGAISVVVPDAWAGEASDAVSLLVAEDLDAALADEWTKGLYLEAVRNTPEQNPGGFAPDVTLDQLIAESECTIRERGPYSDVNFAGSYAVLDQCGTSTLSSYYLVAAPADLSMVVLVAAQFESPEEDEVVQLILDSVVWSMGALP